MSVNRKIAKASIILISASMLGYLLSFFKEILVAARFGATWKMDAYYAAITIPGLIIGVLTVTFRAIFIPVFLKYRARLSEEAQKIANIVISYVTICLLTGVLFIAIFASPIISLFFSGFDLETGLLAVKLLRIVSIMVLFSGFISLSTGILNAYKNFAVPALSSVLVTICVIFFIVFSKESMGIYTLVYGAVIGTFLQFILLAFVLKRKGFRYRVAFDQRHPGIGQIKKQAPLFLLSALFGQLNIVVDRLMASGLIAGSIAALGYADKLVQAPLQIFSRSIATAAFPFFATQVAENKVEELKDSLAANIRMAGFILIPLTVMLMVLSEPIIRLFFERGEFTPQATQLTAIIFRCYALQLFFKTIAWLLVRVFYALQDMKVIIKLGFIQSMLNVIFNLILMKYITPPVAGIALSTSMVLIFYVILSFIFLKRKLTQLRGYYILKGISMIMLASLIAGIVTFVVFQDLGKIIISSLIIAQIKRISGAIIIGGATFILVSFLLKIEEVVKIRDIIKEKVY